MAMDLIPKYTRITNYNKLVDRFVTAQVRHPSDKEKERMGTVFALVEILNPWHPNAQIGQTIINTFVREYYKQTNTNEIINFENALKKVNEKLVQITQNGETDWIGKTNAIIAVVCNNHLHLSYSGKIRGYLLRNELLPIINPQETYSYHHPLKTFSAVISGDLKISDKIFFSSNLLFEYLDEKKLHQILSDGDITQVAVQIASVLRSRNIKQANSILIQTTTVKDTDQIPEVLYLDDSKLNFALPTLDASSKKFKENLNSFISRLGSEWKKGQSFYSEQVAPQSKDFLTKTKRFTNKYLTKFKETTIANQKNSDVVRSEISPKTTIIQTQKNIPNVNHYRSTKEKSNLEYKKIITWIKNFTQQIKIFFKNAFSKKNRSKTYAIIAFILLLIFIANIGYLQKINKSKISQTQMENELTSLESKKDDASLALVTQDNEKAKQLVEEINNKLNSFSNYPELQNRINALKNDLTTINDKILNITRLSSGKEIVSFPQANQFFNISDIYYGVDYKTGKIYQKAINSTQSPTEAAQIPVANGVITASGQKDNNIFLLSSKNKMYTLQSSSLSEAINDSGSWKNAISIKSYYDYLYLLDGSAGQIYKYTSSNNNLYSEPTSYVDTSVVDIKNSVDFIVDGNVYILKKDGSIVKLSQGQIVDFTIKNMPSENSTFANPKKIYTEENLNSLYILDNNRIVELDKQGSFIAQYAFDNSITNITDFNINTKTKEIYILNNNTIYKYNY